MLKLEQEDPEVAYRASVALGNIVSMHFWLSCVLLYQSHPDQLYEARDRGTALNPKSAQVMEVKEVMGTIKSRFNDGRISGVIQEINSLVP